MATNAISIHLRAASSYLLGLLYDFQELKYSKTKWMVYKILWYRRVYLISTSEIAMEVELLNLSVFIETY